MPNTQVIALAADTLLYAPLFIAQEAGFFGERRIAFGTLNRTPPRPDGGGAPSLDVPRRPTSFVQREVNTIWQAFSHAKRPPLLTVCDPMHAFLFNLTRATRRIKPVIAGGLLIGPACWFFDDAGNLNELLTAIREGAIGRVATHAPGMTADTLLRWVLLKRGRFEPARLETLVENLEIPGSELARFEDGPPPTGTSHAAVSIDLLTMNYLSRKSQGALRICHDLGDENKLKRYLMTALLAETDRLKEPESKAAIEAVLSGVTLAIRLLQEDPEEAVTVLRQHYIRRATSSDSYSLQACTYLTPLAPLANMDSLEESFQESVKSLAPSYSGDLTPTYLRESLDLTWRIYKEAHQDILPAVCRRPLAKLPVSTSTTLGLATGILSGPNSITRVFGDICLAYRRRLPTLVPHLATLELVAWIKERLEEGKLQASNYSVVGRFVCSNPDRRALLSREMAIVRDRVKGWAGKEYPYTLAVFGPPGSGKDTLVDSFRQDLEKQGVLNRGPTLNLFKDVENAEAVSAKLTEVLKAAKPVPPPAKPLGVWINEVNKQGDTIWGRLSPFVLPDKDSVPAGLTIESLRNTVWFLSGTVPGDKKVAYATIAAAPSGGRDFASRLGEENVLTLPGLTEPLDQLLRFLAVACTDADGNVRPDRPKAVEASVLLVFAVRQIRDARDVNRIVLDANARMQKRVGDVVMIDDVLSPEEAAEFRLVYREHLRDLTGDVTVEWNV